MSNHKIVYVITERNNRKYWNRVGTARVNGDGSIDVQLEAIPTNGKIQIRDYVLRDAGGPDEPVGVDDDVEVDLVSQLRVCLAQAESLVDRLYELPAMDAWRREIRLVRLREQYEYSDDEVLQMVKKGRLPRDPAFAEWLVLLGRGDLVSGSGKV